MSGVANIDDFNLFPDSIDTATVSTMWQQALRDLYGAVKGHRRHQLKGTHSSGFDRLRGIHVASEAWGQVELCEALVPELAFASLQIAEDEEFPRFAGMLVRRAAEEDAVREYADMLRLGDVLERAA